MSAWRQGWLVARREIRERGRSRGFRFGLLLMVAVVVALIIVPALFDGGTGSRTVGVAGATPRLLTSALAAQGDASGTTLDVRRFESARSGEKALRDSDIDVLLVDAGRLEWRGDPEPRLQTFVTTAIQVAVVHERAAASGLDTTRTERLLAPVPVTNVTIGAAPGRSAEDGAAAAMMTVILLASIVIYGNLVLTGVVEEKSSRVVEVLLARAPAKAVLGGKVVGIGLLGFGQVGVTALAALVATAAVDSVDLPAVTGGVLVWVVVWFLLGYSLYAMLYGALGSLASRTEDAQSVAGPVSYVMVAGYWASLVAVGQDPDGIWSRLLSLFPATAPLAMPGRIALGAAAWWEPLLAAALTLAAIVGLVGFAGRVYRGAILHSGRRLDLREAWRAKRTDGRGETLSPSERLTNMVRTPRTVVVVAAAVGVLGVLAAALLFAATTDVIWTMVPLLLAFAAIRGLLRHGGRPSRHDPR